MWQSRERHLESIRGGRDPAVRTCDENDHHYCVGADTHDCGLCRRLGGDSYSELDDATTQGCRLDVC